MQVYPDTKKAYVLFMQFYKLVMFVSTDHYWSKPL